jgi:hypothetical protein
MESIALSNLRDHFMINVIAYGIYFYHGRVDLDN